MDPKVYVKAGSALQSWMHRLAAGFNDDRGDLPLPSHSIDLFYRCRNKVVQTRSPMGKGEEFLFRQSVILRLLFWPLGGVCIDCHVQAEAIQFMVGFGLFLDGDHYCVAERYSVGVDVPVDG